MPLEEPTYKSLGGNWGRKPLGGYATVQTPTPTLSMAPPSGTWWDTAQANYTGVGGDRGALGLAGPGSAPSPLTNTMGLAPWSPQYANYLTQAGGASSQLPNMFNSIYQQQQGMYGPEQAILQGRTENLFQRMQLTNLAFGDKRAALTKGSAADKALLANQAQGNQILLQALGLEVPYINAMRGIDLGSLNLQSDKELRQAKSSATARGAWNTPGLGLDINEIQKGRWFGTQRINTQAEKGIADVGTRRKQLENEAASYGLKADQLSAALDMGLSQLNLDQVMSTGDLIDAINSTDQNAAQIGRMVEEAALNLYWQSLQTGISPLFPTRPTGVTGGGSYVTGGRQAQ